MCLKDFPMPPTLNKGYFNLPRGGRAPTKELRDFKRQVELWILTNKSSLGAFKQLWEGPWNRCASFKLTIYFIMAKEKLYTLQGKAKKLDVSNRIKFAEDGIAQAIGIDDRYFFSVSAEKLIGEKEHCVVMIEPHYPISSVELMKSLEGGFDSTSAEQ